MKLGLYLGWHVHPFEELLGIVRQAESLGYAAVLVDGDVSMLARRPEEDCLDGWTVTTALLALTQRIQIGSLRLVHHWNAARLAQAVATAHRIAPGRLRFAISIGDWEIDSRFGLPRHGAAERVAWLDETLDAARALWRGETVTRRGAYVQLDAARVRPAPGHLPVTVAARRARMLDLVAAHADVWDVNLPAIPAAVREAADRLSAACERRGRDASEITRSMLLFARLGDPEAGLAQFRRFNPWFAKFPDSEIAPALLVGEPARLAEGLRHRAGELGLELPILDLSGLEAGATRRLLDALGEANNLVDTGT